MCEQEKLYNEANCRGLRALLEATPVPMVVQQRESAVDDSSAVKKSWFVEGGVCGFASIVIQPARGRFVKWLKENNMGYRHYYGGYEIPVNEGGQSMQRKEAYAHAFAKALIDAGIKAHTTSRMD